MRVGDVLRRKGDAVVTIAPSRTVHELLALLAEHGIGAVVVSADGSGVDGIVSERDVVRRLVTDGAALLDASVASIMSSPVRTCTRDDTLEALMPVMTERRIRHLPVVDEGRMIGIVSIGDVVKNLIEHVAAERDQLESYITG